MQERALPRRVQAAAVQILAVTGGVLALGKVQRREIPGRFDRVDARTAELVREQARDLQRDVAHVLGIDAETVLTREQAVVRVLVVAASRARQLTIGVAGDNQPDDVADVPVVR